MKKNTSFNAKIIYLDGEKNIKIYLMSILK